MSSQTISHHWHEVVGKLRERWSSLTPDDLHAFDGDVDKLVSKIARLTGESREEVQEFIEGLGGNFAWIAEELREKTARAASQAVSGVREGYASARTQANRTVQQYPLETVLVAFGVGLLSGLGIALLARERPQPSRMERTRRWANDLAHRSADALADVHPEKLARYVRR